MSYENTRKALYYRTTTDGKTKWVRVEGAETIEKRRIGTFVIPQTIILYDWQQRGRNPSTFVRDE